MKREQIEEEKEKLREEFEDKIREIKSQYEEEKMSKEMLQKQMDSLKANYDSQINKLDENEIEESGDLIANTSSSNLLKPKKSGRKVSGTKKQSNSQQSNGEAALLTQQNGEDSFINSESGDAAEINDPAQRLLKLQELVVGGEQANNEELKKKRIKKKKYAEERKKLLAESLRNGDDEEFMLSVYDSVQEEVKFKTKLLDKEKEQVKFLKNEVNDLQHEFEKEREEYLDTIRKQERQIKLLNKITQKIQALIPHDCNYYNIDKINSVAMWNEEIQDWILPDIKREKLTLPTMGPDQNEAEYMSNQYEIMDTVNTNGYSQMPPQQILLNGRRQLSNENPPFMGNLREPEIDRYRLKLESSQFNGTNYFKTRRQSELLSQTQELKNGRLSPINNLKNRRPYP